MRDWLHSDSILCAIAIGVLFSLVFSMTETNLPYKKS